ncbi:MAG: TonB-dependent receptor plug domain-containing protein, partial [Ignavibacteriae bacterium]|nr:TonB-dependent receptor plug domain-containing protein [Ignavibacteriota bacterium]
MKTPRSILLNITILLISLSVGVFGQSTKKTFGYVSDRNTNLPLVGANILIDGTGIGTTSNELGYFQFDNIYTGTYSITASFIGYKGKSISDININNDQPSKIIFQLKPIEHKLDEVVVSSNKNYDQNFGNVKLYTRKEIEKNNFQSVGELLQQTAGVEIQPTGATGSSTKISIRGSQSNQVLVLLDGVQLNNQLGGDVDLSQIPTNIIERIEVYEGGSSAQFGSGAIGGTINIVTRNQFKNEIKLNTAIGGFGYLKSEPIVSGTYKNLSYYLSYNYLKSEGDYNYSYTNSSDNQIDDIRLNGDILSGNLFSRINYRVGNNLFSVNGQWFNSERGIPGEVYSLTPYARSNNSNKTLGFNYSGGFKKLNIKSDLIYSNSTSEYSNLFPDD